MAARSTWKGYLKVSLVNIPIKVFPAIEPSSGVSFNQLHSECQSRIQQKRYCPTCQRDVQFSEIVKGYEFEKGRYVVMTEEEISKVRPESTRVINLNLFTNAADIDPVLVEKAYYLAPDGAMAAEAFAVMREGMRGKAGVGKLAVSGREYFIAVQPREQGMVMYTLHHKAELRPMDQIDELQPAADVKLKADEVKLAKQVIGSFEGQLNLADYRDDYQAQLRKIIDAKISGEEVVEQEVEEPTKVVNLMEALRRSLDAVSAGKKTPAKAGIAKASAAAEKPARAEKKRARA